MAEVNFELQPQYRRCFDTLEPRSLLDQIGVLRGKALEPGRSLLFLDEIQECPRAIVALRYLYEQVPELHVIGAGSLLEFALVAERLRMPVGRVQSLFMYPLSFAEFLQAGGEEPALAASTTFADGLTPAVHEHLLSLLRTYLLVGGMPAVIQEYLASGSAARALRVQTTITQTLRDDFGKYARQARHRHLDRVFGACAKLDYLMAAGGAVVPVEVKAGQTGRLRSLAAFSDRYRPPLAVRVYGGPFRRDGHIVSVPLYALERLPQFVTEAGAR